MLLRICTYNIHKGFSQFNRRMVVHELRESLRGLGADLVFLQEVQGRHRRHRIHYADWPRTSQHAFLAEGMWQQTAYGGNAIYRHGHHGNAMLSRYPILAANNEDVTDHRFERRGLLHCEIALPGHDVPLHCFCVHLGLTGGSRRRQIEALVQRVERLVPPAAPLIIAGDFNDWRNRATTFLRAHLGVQEAFGVANGLPARSFPSILPVLRLDRIYIRGFNVHQAYRYAGGIWSGLSDHAVLVVDLEPEGERVS